MTDHPLPAAGGSYIRDPDTGALTPADAPAADAPEADAPEAEAPPPEAPPVTDRKPGVKRATKAPESED